MTYCLSMFENMLTSTHYGEAFLYECHSWSLSISPYIQDLCILNQELGRMHTSNKKCRHFFKTNMLHGVGADAKTQEQIWLRMSLSVLGLRLKYTWEASKQAQRWQQFVMKVCPQEWRAGPGDVAQRATSAWPVWGPELDFRYKKRRWN